MDRQHLRYHLKVVFNGSLYVDSLCTFGILKTLVREFMTSLNLPRMDLSILEQWMGPQTLSYDMAVGESVVNMEIAVLSNPGVVPESSLTRRHAV